MTVSLEDLAVVELETHVLVAELDEAEHVELIVEVPGIQGPAGAAGTAGATGPQGPQGATGTGGAGYVVHTQSSPAATWTVVHNLGRFPAVTVLDAAGLEVLADVEHGSLNATTIVHGSPMSGSAYFIA